MSYMKAEDILPPDLLAVVQDYIDGAMLYVPRKHSVRNNWGAVNGTKEYYRKRNAMICAESENGVSIRELAKKYCLSPKSIQRIIRSTPSCYHDFARERNHHEPGE